MLFKNKKFLSRFAAVALAGALMLGGSISSYAASAPQTMTHNGVTVTANIGTLEWNPEKAQADLEGIIFDQTGIKVDVKDGTLLNVNDDAVAEKQAEADKLNPQATKAPTALAPYQPYTANWSGTVNYTYTSYYFLPGGFDTEANGTHYVDYYTAGGTHFAQVVATYSDGKYRTSVGISGGDYYAVIHNTASGSSSSAYYTAE